MNQFWVIHLPFPSPVGDFFDWRETEKLYLCFHLVQNIFPSPCYSFLDMIQNMLFNLQIFGNFPAIFLLLMPKLILLQSGHALHASVSGFVLGLGVWYILLNIPHVLKSMWILLWLFRMFYNWPPIILDSTLNFYYCLNYTK